MSETLEANDFAELTDDELQTICERADKATPGRWRVGQESDVSGELMHYVVGPFVDSDPRSLVAAVGDDPSRLAQTDATWRSAQTLANAEFIAHARADIPRLLNHLAAKYRENVSLRADRLILAKGWRDDVNCNPTEMFESACELRNRVLAEEETGNG